MIKAKDELGFPCLLVIKLQGKNADQAQEIINAAKRDRLFSKMSSENAAALSVRLSS